MKILFIILLPIVLAGCSLTPSSTGSKTSEADVVPRQDAVVVVPESISVPMVVRPAPEVTPTINELSIKAFAWAFQPDTITVKKGDRVRLSITSTDVAHGFALPDFGVHQDLESGKTSVIEFTADKQGRFSFFCSVFCGDGHRGMKGLLIVE